MMSMVRISGIPSRGGKGRLLNRVCLQRPVSSHQVLYCVLFADAIKYYKFQSYHWGIFMQKSSKSLICTSGWEAPVMIFHSTGLALDPFFLSPYNLLTFSSFYYCFTLTVSLWLMLRLDGCAPQHIAWFSSVTHSLQAVRRPRRSLAMYSLLLTLLFKHLEQHSCTPVCS